MTNHWIDIGNSDCILIMGSNAAENHPISFKWVTKAMENDPHLVVVLYTDEDTTYGAFVQVLGGIKKSGCERIAIQDPGT